MFASRWPSMTYASTGVIRGEPSLVNVPIRTNWNRSSSSRPCAAISGAACSSSSHVSMAEAKQMPSADRGSFDGRRCAGAGGRRGEGASLTRAVAGLFSWANERKPMVKVEAVVVRERVETVIDAVEEETGHVGVTVVEAIGHGRERGVTHEYRGRTFESRFLPKALLTFVVDDALAERVAAAIVDAARTGYSS